MLRTSSARRRLLPSTLRWPAPRLMVVRPIPNLMVAAMDVFTKLFGNLLAFVSAGSIPKCNTFLAGCCDGNQLRAFDGRGAGVVMRADGSAPLLAALVAVRPPLAGSW